MHRMVGLALVMVCAATSAVAAPGPYDGVYRGEIQGAGGGQCVNYVATLRVKDNVATLRYAPEITFEATVTPDGRVDADTRQASISGTIANDRFTGTAGGPRCRYTISIPKQ